MSEIHEKKRMPDTRRSVTHKVRVTDERGGDTALYITAGYYDEGPIGELFVSIGKQGSTLKGVLDSFAIMVSMGLQYGVPLDSVIDKFRHVAFEPSGPTTDPAIPACASLVDYIAQWLETHRALDPLVSLADARRGLGLESEEADVSSSENPAAQQEEEDGEV